MDFTETPEQQDLRHVVAQIARSYGHDYYTQKARAGDNAAELWHDLADAGFVGVGIPERDGGGGAGVTELSMVCEELAAAGCPLLLMIVSSAIGGSLLSHFGDERQREEWLRPLAAGTLRMAFALTEPEAGTNTHNLTTTAYPDGDGYRLWGSKHYITGIDEADQVLVVARTGTQTGALSLFIVDTAAPGITLEPIRVELVAPETQYTVTFDDVPVPGTALLGAEGNGLRQLFTGLNPERITSAATSIGIARYAIAHASEYAQQRSVWDVPIGAHQGLAHRLAQAKIDVDLAELMVRKAGVLHDQGQDASTASNMAKYAAAEASLTALDESIQIHGGNGLSSEFGLADLWGVARLMRTAPVSREMVLNHIAQHDLNLPRSY